MNTLSSLLMFIGHNLKPSLGEIKMYAGATAPQGWKICNGEAISRSDYSDLFSVIGTTYGAGDGSTTFNLPDFRGRAAIGAGTGTATDATAHSLGSNGGTETVTLNVSQIPSHGHLYGDATVRTYGSTESNKGSSSWQWGGYATLSGLIGNTGGGQAHNNMQPYAVVNYIIYVGE